MIIPAQGHELMQYLQARLPYPPDEFGPGSFLASEGGYVRAAWSFEPSARGALELHVAADDPRWALRSNLKAMFRQGFEELGATRILTGIGEHNKRSFRLARWMGFDAIGLLPRWYGEEGCFLMDMLPENCRWLEGNDG